LISFSTTSGTVATRFSPGAVSFGTPMRMVVLLAMVSVLGLGQPAKLTQQPPVAHRPRR
jgi:hypothetical protein